VDVRSHYVVVDSFFADARALRRAYEARFGERVPPFHPSRFAWEYWHVPGQFAQHRAPARDVFPADVLARFEARLLAWSGRALGLGVLASPPWVSFVLDGDYQGIHRDSPNGLFAFTYGLSRPGRPRFSGGETLLARPELLDYWRRGGAREDCADEPLFEAIAPAFNRLVAFDSRVPHAVRAVEGPRDPRDGRVAIQGWLRPRGCVLHGALAGDAHREQANDPSTGCVRAALSRVGKRPLAGVAGLCSVRLEVAAAGHVKRATLLVDTLVSTTGDEGAAPRASRAIVAAVGKARFPATRGASVVIAPVVVTPGAASVDSRAP
jgi:hypothetical protein